MSPQIKNSVLGLYKYFKDESNKFKNWLYFPMGDL